MNAYLSQHDEKNRLHMRKIELEKKEQKEVWNHPFMIINSK